MARKPTGRRRGGQPGNHNRLLHGLYSKRDPPGPQQAIPLLNRTDTSLALVRARLKTVLYKQAADPEHFLSYERATQYYFNLILRLINRQLDLRFREQPELTDLPSPLDLELLRHLSLPPR